MNIFSLKGSFLAFYKEHVKVFLFQPGTAPGGHLVVQRIENRKSSHTIVEQALWKSSLNQSDVSDFPSVAKEHCAMLRHDNPDNNAAAISEREVKKNIHNIECIIYVYV